MLNIQSSLLHPPPGMQVMPFPSITRPAIDQFICSHTELRNGQLWYTSERTIELPAFLPPNSRHERYNLFLKFIILFVDLIF